MNLSATPFCFVRACPSPCFVEKSGSEIPPNSNSEFYEMGDDFAFVNKKRDTVISSEKIYWLFDVFNGYLNF